jgi:hypothetical protein
MRTKIGNAMGFLFKLFLVLLGLAIVAYFTVTFNAFSGDIRDYFVRVGNWEMVIYIFLFFAIIAYVLKKLLLWETHAFFGKENNYAPPRRRAR